MIGGLTLLERMEWPPNTRMKLSPPRRPGETEGFSKSQQAARSAGVTRVAEQRSRHRLAQLIRRTLDGVK